MFQQSIHTRESNEQIKSYIIEFFIPTICVIYAYRLHLYLKTRLQHRCFLLYFVKYSRIAFCKKTLGNCFFTSLWPGYFRNIISISSTFGCKFFTNSNIDISPVAFGTSRNLIRNRYHFWRSNIYNCRTSESKMCYSFFLQLLIIKYLWFTMFILDIKFHLKPSGVSEINEEIFLREKSVHSFLHILLLKQ